MKNIPTDQQIDTARAWLDEQGRYLEKGGHVRNDGVRTAYIFLAGQKPIKSAPRYPSTTKGTIETWAGSYTSTDDVITAAHLLGIEGRYPYYKLSVRLQPVCTKEVPGFGRHPHYFGNNVHTMSRAPAFNDDWHSAVNEIKRKEESCS